MDIPLCIKINETAKGWKIIFPLTSDFTIHEEEVSEFSKAIALVSSLASKHKIDMSAYSLVVGVE